MYLADMMLLDSDSDPDADDDEMPLKAEATLRALPRARVPEP
ncbi:hypothetical protein OG875_30755 [Streptomyces sp. NBC_01498]|nr:hypothetical protein [Streptomyces sp. NBC_01498]WTL29066.1 hypothetical protein OG875_30755 [Streptomyces sp. NBC_01498]